MNSLPSNESGRDLDAEREHLYDALTRRITGALAVYAESAESARAAVGDAYGAGGIDVDAVLGLAVEILRGAGDEALAWLIVEAMALRGGPPRKVLDAIIALRTLHKGGPPPLVYTARIAATSGARARGSSPSSPRPAIVPMAPYPGDRGPR